jgi:hypothetical protein
MKSTVQACLPRLASVAVLATTLCAATAAVAQQDSRTVVPEAAPAFPAFQQWVQSMITPLPPAPPAAAPQTLPLDVRPGAPSTAYQPAPVILGAPELPLVRGAGVAAGQWGAQFNYQGMHVRFVILDAEGRARQVRPVSAPPKAGERFKVRVTPTFDAVAEVDLVLGTTWARQRVGQFYPKPGFSVQVKAGETADLPLGAAEYFVFQQGTEHGAVVSVRHPKALGEERSGQPAYRMDGRLGSDYLQLVPSKRYAAIEQLITVSR